MGLTLNEIIEILNKLKEKHGNLPVCINSFEYLIEGIIYSENQIPHVEIEV